jgi:hypothetical protein
MVLYYNNYQYGLLIFNVRDTSNINYNYLIIIIIYIIIQKDTFLSRIIFTVKCTILFTFHT